MQALVALRKSLQPMMTRFVTSFLQSSETNIAMNSRAVVIFHCIPRQKRITATTHLPWCSRKRFVYSYFEKGWPIKCTRQPRKVLWVVLSSLFFKEIWKNGRRDRGDMSVRAKRKQQKQVRQQQCQEQCIEHIPYYLSGLWRARFFRQLFSK